MRKMFTALNLWNQIYQETGKGLKKELPWLTKVYTQELQPSLKNLDTAFQNFFKGVSKHPKVILVLESPVKSKIITGDYFTFKCKSKKQSTIYPQHFQVCDSLIKFPEIDEIIAKIHDLAFRPERMSNRYSW